MAEPRDGLAPVQKENVDGQLPCTPGISKKSKGASLGGRAVGVHLVPPDLEVPEGHSSGWRDQVASARIAGGQTSTVPSKCLVRPQVRTRGSPGRGAW